MRSRSMFTVLFGTTLYVSLSACSNQPQSAANAGKDTALEADTTVVEGCVTTGQDGRAVLTAAPDQGVSTAARAGTSERKTYTYVLEGGQNLQAHVGKRVEVTGRLRKDGTEVEHAAKERAPSARADVPERTPDVRSTEQVELQVHQLMVQNVRELAPNCVLNP